MPVDGVVFAEIYIALVVLEDLVVAEDGKADLELMCRDASAVSEGVCRFAAGFRQEREDFLQVVVSHKSNSMSTEISAYRSHFPEGACDEDDA